MSSTSVHNSVQPVTGHSEPTTVGVDPAEAENYKESTTGTSSTDAISFNGASVHAT